VTPSALEFIVPAGQARTKGLTLRNTGSVDMTWQLVDDVPWLSTSPASGSVGIGASAAVSATANATGLAPGVYTTTMSLVSNSGRQPSIAVPVKLVVPAYYRTVNAGGSAYTDLAGDGWSADQAYSAGGFGYTSKSQTSSTRAGIAGTADDPLYQSQRVSPGEYRFDGLPSGVYEIDLRFAELIYRQAQKRIFDVIGEQSVLLPAHDIFADVGGLTADDHVFFLPVTDGQLDLRFVPRRGFGAPVVNAIRVRERPDRAGSAGATTAGTGDSGTAGPWSF
jgi:hypothetical protein